MRAQQCIGILVCARYDALFAYYYSVVMINQRRTKLLANRILYTKAACPFEKKK